MRVIPNDRAKWFQFRRKLSSFFVTIARKIYPKNPDVDAFFLECFMDQVIYGKSVVMVNPTEDIK